MAWLLFVGASCLFALSLLFAGAFGKCVSEGAKDNAVAALIIVAISQLAAMSLLFAAGMMFGGA